MKILIIGYGSIGQRHYDVLSNMNANIDIVTKQTLKNKVTFKTIQDVIDIASYDYFIIANLTNKHLECLQYLDNAVKNKIIFCKKPLFSSYIDINLNNNYIYVRYVLRYHPFFNIIKEFIATSSVYFIEISCGSYLPDWCKNIEYTKSYSTKIEEGGGCY